MKRYLPHSPQTYALLHLNSEKIYNSFSFDIDIYYTCKRTDMHPKRQCILLDFQLTHKHLNTSLPTWWTSIYLQCLVDRLKTMQVISEKPQEFRWCKHKQPRWMYAHAPRGIHTYTYHSTLRHTKSSSPPYTNVHTPSKHAHTPLSNTYASSNMDTYIATPLWQVKHTSLPLYNPFLHGHKHPSPTHRIMPYHIRTKPPSHANTYTYTLLHIWQPSPYTRLLLNIKFANTYTF